MFEYIGWMLVLVGCFFNVLSAFGCTIISDFYVKLHAAGIGDTCGSPIALAGIAMINGFNVISLKILMLIPLLLIIAPTATTTLINAGVEGRIIPNGLIKTKLFKK